MKRDLTRLEMKKGEGEVERGKKGGRGKGGDKSLAWSSHKDLGSTVSLSQHTPKTIVRNSKISTNITRKLCYRKDDRAMRPTYGCPENFRDSLTTSTATILIFSWAFVPVDPMNVPTKFEVRCFTRCWDNKGYPKNLGSPWIRPRSLFSKIFNGLLCG